MTEPNKALLDGSVPTVILSGKEWPIPLFAPKQNRKVLPAVLRLRGVDILNINEEQFDDLLTVTYTALTRAHPDLSRDEFDNTQMTGPELIKALGTIARQTGLFGAAKESTSGEATAGNLQTGTP